MAMQFLFNLEPFGDRSATIEFGSIRIVSRGYQHVYSIGYKNADGLQVIHGAIPRKKSGHRNFLHLLKNILDDADLDSLGEGYVNVLSEVEGMFPQMDSSKISDYQE